MKIVTAVKALCVHSHSFVIRYLEEKKSHSATVTELQNDLKSTKRKLTDRESELLNEKHRFGDEMNEWKQFRWGKNQVKAQIFVNYRLNTVKLVLSWNDVSCGGNHFFYGRFWWKNLWCRPIQLCEGNWLFALKFQADLQTAVVIANDFKMEAQEKIDKYEEENALLKKEILRWLKKFPSCMMKLQSIL